MARPKSGKTMDGHMTLRGPKELFAEWRSAAKSVDLSASDWVRASVDKATLMSFRRTPRKRPALREVSPADPVLVAKIAQLGNNLNQVARWVNHHKSAAEASQVLLALAAIEQHLHVILEM